MLLGVLAATMVKFHEVSPAAAYALGPYFLWSSYAAALTASIYRWAAAPLVWVSVGSERAGACTQLRTVCAACCTGFQELLV